MRNPEGWITAYIGIVTDITERREIEIALRETNRKLQTLLNASPVPIVSLDLEGRVTAWNPAAERLFG